MKITFGFFISILLTIELVRCWGPGEFLKNYLNIFSSETSENIQMDTINLEKNEDLDKLKPDVVEVNSFYQDNNIVCETNIKKYDELLKSIDNYVQRYISLFLIISNLHEYKITDSTKEIIIDLEISITEKDLDFLQNLSKNMHNSKYLRNFSKLDDILSKIARAKERSYLENSLRSSKSFFSSFNILCQLFEPRFYRILSFLIIFTVLWTFAVFFKKHIYLLVVVTLNSGIIWEGLNLYWKRVKDKEVEYFVLASQGSNMPESCDPKNKRWYQGLTTIFFGDSCLQYFKEVNKNPLEEVSLLNSIVDTYSFYLIRMPTQLFGASIKDVVGEISGLWPWPLNLIINFPLFLIVAIMLGFFILILCGKRMKLSVLGASVEIQGHKEEPVNKTPRITTTEVAKSIRIIRKLKPWTKSRFPKRLEGDLTRRRRSFGLKSITESPVAKESSSINNTEMDPI